MNFFRSIRDFLVNVQTEFKRVSWPTREATLNSTGVVIFLVLVIGLFLGTVDLGLSEVVKFLIR